jgi:hypothetical protein
MNKKPRALMLVVIGVFALMYVVRSIMSGVVNLGGRSGDFMIVFQDRPALFVIGIVFIIAMACGLLAIAWRDWRAGGIK